MENWGPVRWGCAVIGVLAIVVALSFAMLYWNGALSFLGMNIQRQVTQQSLPYIQAHQQQLLGYWADYQTGDQAHQAADTTLICQEAPLLDRSQWPPQIESFFAQHCQ